MNVCFKTSMNLYYRLILTCSEFWYGASVSSSVGFGVWSVTTAVKVPAVLDTSTFFDLYLDQDFLM